jgi:hypothetical protein
MKAIMLENMMKETLYPMTTHSDPLMEIQQNLGLRATWSASVLQDEQKF